MTRSIVRQRLSEKVAGRIKDLIVEQALKPGDRLPTEHELALRFGVSRVSIREATKALAFLGILESAPRRGITIGALDLRRLTQYLEFHLAIHDVSLDSLIASRIALETGGLERASDHMARDPAIYDELRGINEELGRARMLQKRVTLDIAFHRALLAASGLEPLVAFNDLLGIFFARFQRSFRAAKDDVWKEGVESHRRIIDALRAGELERAREELRVHIESHRLRMKTLRRSARKP